MTIRKGQAGYSVPPAEWRRSGFESRPRRPLPLNGPNTSVGSLEGLVDGPVWASTDSEVGG